MKRTAESLERSNRHLEEANAQLRRDLAAAAKVQRSHLPERTPVFENYEFAWKYEPCEQLGGDNLHIMPLSEDHVGFYVLDVSGHGVQAALLSVAIKHLLEPSLDDTSVVNRPNRHRTREADSRFIVAPPREVAERLNRHFVFDQTIGQFFTIFYGVLDMRAGLPLRINRTSAADSRRLGWRSESARVEWSAGRYFSSERVRLSAVRGARDRIESGRSALHLFGWRDRKA